MTLARHPTGEVQGAAHTTAGNYDTVYAAGATPVNGVCVLIVQTGSAADQVTSVQYGTGAGAVVLTERRFVPITTEAGAVYLYWASGVTFPSGTQTLRIAKGAVNLRAVVAGMTVAAGQQAAVDFDTASVSTAAVANPSWSHVCAAANTLVYEAIVSGLQTMTNTPRQSPVVWTVIGTSEDVGAQGRGWARVTRTSAGECSPGWIAATAEDYAAASISFKEAPLASAVTLTPAPLVLAPVAVTVGAAASEVTLTPASVQLAPAALAGAAPVVALAPAPLALAAAAVIPGPHPPVDGVTYDSAGVSVAQFTRETPATGADGDLGILVVGYVVSATGETLAVSAESGTGRPWSAVTAPVPANNLGFAVLHRRKQAGDSATVTVTVPGEPGRFTTAAVEWYDDADVGVVGALGNRAGVTSTTITAPGITASAAGRRILGLFVERTTAVGTTVAVDQGLIRQYVEGTGNSTCSVAIADFVAPAAATGSVTATYSGAGSGNGVGLLVELIPPGGGPAAVTLTPAQLALAAPPVTLTPVLALPPAVLVLAARPLTATPTVTLSPAVLQLAATAVTLQPTVVLSPAPLALIPVAVGTGAASLLTLTPAVLAVAPRPLTATPAVPLSAAVLALAPRALALTPVVPLSAAGLQLAPVAVALQPTVVLSPAVLVLAAAELGLPAFAVRDVWVRIRGSDTARAELLDDAARCTIEATRIEHAEVWP